MASVSNVKSDISASYEYMLDELNLDPDKIVLYGQSLGSGASCYLASREQVAGVVLHSPLMSGLRVIREIRKTHCFDIFPNIDLIDEIEEPVFIIHGTRDHDIPIEHGLALYEQSRKLYDP